MILVHPFRKTRMERLAGNCTRWMSGCTSQAAINQNVNHGIVQSSLDAFIYSIFRSFPFAQSLSIFFLIFPVLVFGSSSTTSTSLGTANLLMPRWSLAHLIRSSPVSFAPDLIVMNAFGRSPQWLSDTPATPHSRMSGCVTRMLSSATEDMFSPPSR